MRRIVCLLLLITGCDDNHTGSNPDLTMVMMNGDLGADASSCTNDTACTLAGGAKGLCKSGACAACANNTDDTACDTAYSTPSAHFICIASACTAGCRTGTDCGGQICGLSAANVCAACMTDAQCQMFSGSDTICETATGKCVSNACTTVSTACAANAGDFCCASGGSNICSTGNCCSNADCSGGKNCVNHQCTNCAAPSANLLVVDPSEVAGGAPTGADVAGCRYKTITAAVLASPAPGTTIKVLGTQTLTGDSASCTAHTGECFPIPVNTGIAIAGDAAMRPTISDPNNSSVVFSMGPGGASLTRMTLDGASAGVATAGYGVTVLSAVASPSPAPSLSDMTVTNFGLSGVQLSAGMLDIGPGVNINKCDVGLELTNDGVVANVHSSTTPIIIGPNVHRGIKVSGGALSVTGTAGVGGAGTVQVHDSGFGIEVLEATQGTTSAFAVNLDGVAVWSNASDGVKLTAGTPLSIHNSYILNNGNGVHIVSAGTISAATMALINLGTAHNGNNTLQQITTGFSNAAAGICLQPGAAAAGTTTLSAEGNIFKPNFDCTTLPSPGPIPIASPNCVGSATIATTDTTYGFDVAYCAP